MEEIANPNPEIVITCMICFFLPLAFVSCESGDMIVTINFKDAFHGVIFANKDPKSPCNIVGEGDKVYTLRLPLRGCGTREVIDGPRASQWRTCRNVSFTVCLKENSPVHCAY